MIIRKDLLRDPKFKKFDDAVKPLIKPILDNETGITKMRHNYIAHIQERGRKFHTMMNDIVIEHNLPTDWASWNYFTGLAFYYWGLVDSNFKEEADKALRKYDAKVGHAVTIDSGFKMDDVNLKINELFLPLTIELDKQGFNTTFSDEDLEKVKTKLKK